MLKIKDNVDLKELEKYDFIFKQNICYKPLKRDKQLIAIWINLDNRTIDCSGILSEGEKLNDLYNLIKADLVEKVDQ